MDKKEALWTTAIITALVVSVIAACMWFKQVADETVLTIVVSGGYMYASGSHKCLQGHLYSDKYRSPLVLVEQGNGEPMSCYIKYMTRGEWAAL